MIGINVILELIKAALFGIVEGITEWLPISSTGHLILLEEFINFEGVSEGFWEMFEVVVQLGAIIAVVILFWNKIWPFKYEKINGKTEVIRMDKIIMWLKVAVACIPAIIVGLTINDWCEAHFYNGTSVGIMLMLLGTGFIADEQLNKNKKPKINSIDEITFGHAALIGVFQIIAAIFPGTSRSGATILGGLSIGISRVVACEFTFILGIPVMFGASVLKIFKFGFDFTMLELGILAVGMTVAFLVSLVVIKFLMGFVRKHSFACFGWYRIVLGAAVMAYFLLVK